MPWTQPQQAAIDKRNADILVSAAAGSGKTAVLTERVINRIIGTEHEKPIQVDRFLIVTFTSAAANEMKERIAGKLSDRMALLQQDNAVEHEKLSYLERQIALVQTASISTIHSFCLKIIKTYFHKLNIDPNIKVGNQAELMIMKMDILQEIIEQRFEEEDEDFIKIAEVYGSVQGMAPLASLIIDIHTFSKSTPFPEVWLDEKVTLLSTPYSELEGMPWATSIKAYISSEIKDVKVLYKEAQELCSKANGPELYSDLLRDDMHQITNISMQGSLDEMLKGIQAIAFKALPRKKQECDEGLKERVKDYRNLAKETIKALQEDLSVIGDYKVREHLPQVGSLMKILVQLIKDFEASYQEAKQSAGIVDYNDLEHLCMKVLVEPQFDTAGELKGIVYTDAAQELNQFYREIYIDEYQDSNAVQEMILSAIAQAGEKDAPTRFMVGDMKQSIYRFRLANPLIFSNKYENWEKYALGKDTQSKQICIDLSQNFRSRANILEGINEIFEQIMSKDVGELEYDEYAALKVGNHYESKEHNETTKHNIVSNSIALHILETKDKDAENGTVHKDGTVHDVSDIEELKNIELEALMTATLIDKLLKGQENPTHLLDAETKTYRKIEPRDIVILLRATKSKASVYENALITKGIGAYADVASSFFDALEIQVILSFIKIIDNPFQDIPLITILRSPVVDVSFDDLVVIRKSLDQGSFYEALKVYALRTDAKDNIKAFMIRLQAYREQSGQLTLEELIAKIYVETGYYRYVTMLATGAKKKANLEMLKKYAGEFEISHNGGLFSFIQYLEKLKETSDSLGEAKLVGDHENLVRIMSIHKSKGLEFGIVFLCDTAKKFNNSDIIKNVLLHSELGLAPDFIDTAHHVRYPTVPKVAIKKQITSENISEEMRVLYVALTRAKEKLFITGTVADFTRKAKNWSLFAVRDKKEILPLGVKKAGSYLNWIGMSLFAHPDISAIREAAEIDLSYQLEGNSKWELMLWDKTSLALETKSNKASTEQKKELFSSWDVTKAYGEQKEEIYKRLSFNYPHQKAIILPTKLSVSEIKNKTAKAGTSKDNGDMKIKVVNDDKKIPCFINEEVQIQGAKRGTLIHSVFEHLDFLSVMTEEEIAQEISRLIKENKIKEEVLKVLDLKQLAEITKSEMILRMRQAKYVWKEKQFAYLVYAHSIDEDYPEDEQILIQGVIDTFFIEADGIVIIDYKTDYVDISNKEKSIEAIKERYRRQLELYAQALEGITRLPIKEKCMYLYSINTWVNL